MTIGVRHIVAVLLLVFAWRGHSMPLSWPPAPRTDIIAPVPPTETLAWASDLRPIAAKMLPADRLYMANFYDALGYILTQEIDRGENGILPTNEDFEVFHRGSLVAAIERGKVGKYDGMDKAIDAVFFKAIGTDEPRKITLDEKKALVVGCAVLTHTFGIGRDG